MSEEMHEDDQIDLVGLAEARWLRVIHTLLKSAEECDGDYRARLALRIELELGLRSLLDLADSADEPASIEALVREVERFGDKHPEFMAPVVLALERALAGCPAEWLNYVERNGRAAFDPVDLASAAAIARSHLAPGAPDHRRVVAILHWCWDALLGQRPVPFVRAAIQHGHPTIILDVIKEIERLEVNWESLGAIPIVDGNLAVRWDEYERWTAFVRLSLLSDGRISRDRVLRLRSDGVWRIVRL